jgi:hypothetical protein
MGEHELDVFIAGIAQARAKAYVRHASRGRKRPMLEIMCRDEETAEAIRKHFGGGRITRETPRYRRDIESTTSTE